jgi:hypothetical protein
VEQLSSYILELSNQNSGETKAIMFSHHLFSYSKIQKLDVVMTMEDIVMPNPTNGEGMALKISTPYSKGDNAATSPMTTLPSFTKGEGAKLHVVGTPYATSQETTNKEKGFKPSSPRDLQGSLLINPACELVHKYT